MVPADFKFANKGVITDVNPQGFSLELEYKPDGILKSNYCEFYLDTKNGTLYFDSYATGKRIQQLRKANGMTQEELAIKLNISDRHLRNLERGEEAPSIDLFVEIKTIFNSTLDYLILGSTPSEQEELMKKRLCAKLHRIARSLDTIADDL